MIKIAIGVVIVLVIAIVVAGVVMAAMNYGEDE